MLPFLAWAALYFRHHRVDPRLRPGPAWTLGLWTSAIAIAGVGAYQVYEQVAPRR
jgi:hypothetical protein